MGSAVSSLAPAPDRMSRSRGRRAGHAVRPWTGAAPFSVIASPLSVDAPIRDPHPRGTVDARIPVHLAAELTWNQEAVFVGLLHFKGRRGELRPEFRVDAVHEAGTLRLTSKAELLKRWAEAAARPKPDVRAALAGERPHLVFITGVGSVAVDDVRAQLRA